MTPKEAYDKAKKLRQRCPELESLLVRPYNRQLKKFVSRESERTPQMFMIAFAYYRKFVKNSPDMVRKEFEADLEKNLLKHFLPYPCFIYANTTGRKLPESLHSRIILESFTSNNIWIREYVENYGEEKQEKFSGVFLSKPQEAHNCILDNPGASDEDVAKILRKKGIEITISTIVKARKKIATR